jgi:hypothetical protein
MDTMKEGLEIGKPHHIFIVSIVPIVSIVIAPQAP